MSLNEHAGAPPASGKARSWAGTLNNYTNEEYESLQRIDCTYFCIGKEVAPTTGTLHLQMCFFFKNPIRRSTLQDLCPRASWGALYPTSTQDKLAKYCKKEGNFVEKGLYTTPKQNGDREKERYEHAWTMAKAGDMDAIDADIRIRCYGTLKRIYHDTKLNANLVADIDGDMEHEWYWGEAGTGKTMKARTENPGAFIKSCNKWWDGYTGQDVVIIEDFDIRHECLTHYMKIWCDRWKFPAEVKGSSMVIRPRKIIVTSNYSIGEIWTKASDLGPLKRRFKEVQFPEGQTFPIFNYGN